MSLLGNLFGKSDNKDTQRSNLIWSDLVSMDQLSEIDAASHEMPIFIFKHSTRCAVSRMALRQFESHFDIPAARGYFLDLLTYRDISNAIAARYNLVHQSPQLLLIKDGACIFTESHGEIDAADLKEKIHNVFEV